jgi:hypothetical protein
MGLRLAARRSLILLAAGIAALAILLSLTATLGSAGAKTTHHSRAAVHHVSKDTDTETTGSESESSAPETDGPGGPDAGGDHQCPPACSPGEQG